tara:strand:+ start:1114 stop:2088 length:975 start_codon:yes stop_codon:yes gene_type:complete
MIYKIAELCQNHNGDVELLWDMVHAAKESGATHIKIQTIFADRLSYRTQFENGLKIKEKTFAIKRPYGEEYERLKPLELSLDVMSDFVQKCKKINVVPITTCFARADIAIIKNLGFETIKVASYDCGSFQLLRELKENFSNLIVSTGATYDDEIKNTANILSNTNFHFLHCVTIYPTPIISLNLSRMQWLRQFSDRVGFSDHSLKERDGIMAPMCAIAMGAETFECHFTIIDRSKSKDGPVSVTPKEFLSLSDFCDLSPEEKNLRLADYDKDWKEKSSGSATRPLSEEELLNRDYYRGRFASPRIQSKDGREMIYNWEELPIEQ